MDFLQDWVRNLVALVVLLSLVELLLPQDSLKPYVGMMLGLLVVVGLVQPLLYGINHWEPRLPAVEAPVKADLESLKLLAGRIRERGAETAAEAFPRETSIYRLLAARLPELHGAELEFRDGTLRVDLGQGTSGVTKEEILSILREAGWDQVKVEVIRDGTGARR